MSRLDHQEDYTDENGNRYIWNQSRTLKIWHFANSQQVNYYFWCDGCKELHPFTCGNSNGRPTWQFDGNLEKPTFHPSLLMVGAGCHLFLKEGIIEYLNDCTHHLKGQKVPLPLIPEDIF